MRLVLACLLFLLALAAPASASACTVTWTGGAGTTSWGTAGNWSGGAIPTASDSACLPSGATVVVNGGYTVGSVAGPDARLTVGSTLTLADATTPSQVADLGVSGGLAGAGSIEATHTFDWTGGTLAGSGDTVIAASATGTFAAGSQTIDGRTLTNHGTTTWTTGNLTGRNGARFVNDGTFHANADNAYISLYTTGSATFTNSGTLDKTAGTASTSFYLPVTNTGTANGETGTLNFGGGGGGDGGTWTGKINLSSGTFDPAAMTLAGTISVGGTVNAGHIDGAGAHVTVSGGTLSVADTSTVTELVVSGGTLSGAGALTATDTFRWTNGTLAGTGETVIGTDATGTITLPTFSSQYIDGRTLTNRGTTTWTAGSFSGKNNARIVNSGTFHANADGYYIGLYTTNSASFRNDGTLDKTTGTGSVSMSIPLTNAGTIDARTGTLGFASGGGADAGTSGTWTTSADGKVNFNGGTFTPDSMTLSGNITVTNAGNVDAGHVDGPDATLTVTQGTFGVRDAPADAARRGAPSPDALLKQLTLGGGTFNGSGQLEITDKLDWTTGSMSGDGETVIDPDALAQLNLSGYQTLDTRTLTNRGTVDWNSGGLYGKNGATIENFKDFHANSETGVISQYSTNSMKIRNHEESTFEKLLGTGSTGINAPFTSLGEVRLGKGQLSFTGGDITGEPSGGEWCAQLDGEILFSSGRTFTPVHLCGRIKVNNGGTLNATQITGSADLSISNGSLNLTGAGDPSYIHSLAMSGGTLARAGQVIVESGMSWTGGEMRGAGETTLPAGSTSTISPLDYVKYEGTLNNAGDLTWITGGIYGINAPKIFNSGVWRANSQNGSIATWSSPVGRLSNTGTFKKSTGTSTTSVQIPVENDGVVAAETGKIDFSGGGIPSAGGSPLDDPLLCPTATAVQSGSWTTSGSASIDFSSGCFTLAGGTRVSGVLDIDGATVLAGALDGLDATVYASSGKLSLRDATTPSQLRSLYVSSTVTGPGELDVCGTFTWVSGTMSGTGKTVLCPGNEGTIGAPTAGSVTLDRRWLVNKGDLTWSNGSIIGQTGAIISNWGVLHANSESGSMSPVTGAGLSALVNHGEVRKDQGTNATSVCFEFIQKGTLSQVSGTVTFCGAWNRQPVKLQGDPPKCALNGTGAELNPDNEDAALFLGGSVICSREVGLIRIGFMADGVDLVPGPDMTPDDAGWVCEETDICGPALYVGPLPIPLGGRDCVPYVIYAYIEGGEEPEPVRGEVCVPGVDEP